MIKTKKRDENEWEMENRDEYKEIDTKFICDKSSLKYFGEWTVRLCSVHTIFSYIFFFVRLSCGNKMYCSNSVRHAYTRPLGIRRQPNRNSVRNLCASCHFTYAQRFGLQFNRKRNRLLLHTNSHAHRSHSHLHKHTLALAHSYARTRSAHTHTHSIAVSRSLTAKQRRHN